MKKSFLISGIILSGIFFEGCKKGEEDPFLSLRSRKARLEGEWKLNSGTSTYSQPSSNTNTTTTFTNTTQTTTGTVWGLPVNNTSPYTFTIKMNKDGTYESTINDDGDITLEKGRWTFAGGTGDYKKKEQVVMSPTSVTDENGNTTTYANSDYSSAYDLVMLKNKEMKIKLSQSTTTSSGGTTTQTVEFSFVQ